LSQSEVPGIMATAVVVMVVGVAGAAAAAAAQRRRSDIECPAPCTVASNLSQQWRRCSSWAHCCCCCGGAGSGGGGAGCDRMRASVSISKKGLVVQIASLLNCCLMWVPCWATRLGPFLILLVPFCIWAKSVSACSVTVPTVPCSQVLA